jgi:hypothetical protein
MAEALRVSTECPLYLHPDFAEQAMGYPSGWTVLEGWATPSFPKSPLKSSAP